MSIGRTWYVMGCVSLVMLAAMQPGWVQSRRVSELPGDRCSGYAAAFKQHALADVQLMMANNSDWVCTNAGKDVLAALEAVKQYGTDPDCFSDPYWYRAYQPWFRDFERSAKESVTNNVRSACEKVRSTAQRRAASTTDPAAHRLSLCKEAINSAQRSDGKSSNAAPKTAARIWGEGPPDLLCSDFPAENAVVREMKEYWQKAVTREAEEKRIQESKNPFADRRPPGKSVANPFSSGPATSRETSSGDKCLVPSEVSPGITCDKTDSYTIKVRNDCDGPRWIQICLEKRSGEVECIRSPYPIRVGDSYSHHVCNPTRRHSVSAID